MQSGGKRERTIGLATVAMLKVNFDNGRDHIAMFEPFVLDAVRDAPSGDFSADDIRSAIIDRHDLRIPINTLTTLLRRSVRTGLLQREGGRYFRTDATVEVADLVAERSRIEARQQRLGVAFQLAATEQGAVIESAEDALGSILDFLKSYHVAMALDDDAISIDTDRPSSGEKERHRRLLLTARFLTDVVAQGGELADVLQEMLEGFVLQNTLLLRDISTASRRFADLHVFADSGLLFGALGLRGPAAETAALELVGLLRETGAVLDVFEPTIREMSRILAIYEERIGTHAGRMTLFPTELTRHLLATRYTPSDIRMQSSLIRPRLREFGFNIRELPAREARWTLDEAELGRLLADPEQRNGENRPRVLHDVDCTAGVLIYRAGRTASSLDDAVAVFATTSGMTVRNTKRWYSEQGGRGVPPIVHYLALSNLAWLKKPALAAGLKLHELVALCSAALRPSNAAWQRFSDQLRALEASEEITSDEITAVIASDLTERLLIEEEIDEDSDATSVTEVIERVKASYKQESDAAVSLARDSAARAAANAEAIRSYASQRTRGLARAISWFIVIALGLSFIVGTALSVISASGGSAPSAVACVLAVGPLAIAGLLGVLWGFHLKSWRSSVEQRLGQFLESWLFGGRR